jgi:tRNA(Ile2) C34 agmatinyltransferase TiaS
MPGGVIVALFCGIALDVAGQAPMNCNQCEKEMEYHPEENYYRCPQCDNEFWPENKTLCPLCGRPLKMDAAGYYNCNGCKIELRPGQDRKQCQELAGMLSIYNFGLFYYRSARPK